MNYYISGRSGFLGTAISKHINSGDWTDLIITIRRGQSVDELIKLFDKVPPDVIIHLGTYGNHYDQKDFRQIVETNVIGTYNLLEAAKSFDYKTFYNVSTSSVLLKDQTYYSITKFCGEQLAGMYKNVVNVRPYSVYGPGEASHRFVPTVIKCLNSGEEMTLDETATHAWIFIDDFVKAMFAGEIELGGSKTSNIEIVRILEDISGKKLKYKSGRLRSYDTDNWVMPKPICYTNLQEGLKLTYEYFTRQDY
jgi:nucleoside-diphosphate-sugar epimerase